MIVEFTNDTGLAYVNGRLKALENRMVSRADFEQWTELPDSQLEKVLSERDYTFVPPESIAGKKKDDISFILNSLKPFGPYRDFIRWLCLKDDLVSIRSYFKKKNADSPREKSDYPFFFRAYVLSGEEVRRITLLRQFALLSPFHAKETAAAFAGMEKAGTPERIDALLDRLYLGILFFYLAPLKNPFLDHYFSQYADLLNLETMIRFKMLNRSLEEAGEYLVRPGTLGPLTVRELFSRPREEWPEMFRRRPYYDILKEGLARSAAEGHFRSFARLKDDHLGRLVRRARQAAFGIEPVFAYLQGKETEYMNLRLVVEGRKRKIKPALIRENLRETYV